MPSASSNSGVTMHALPVAPRYLRRNAARAMGGSVVRGLVELITNARDSGYRLIAGGSLGETELVRHPVEVDYVVWGTVKRFVVRDRFEGMSEEIMRGRLIEYGSPAASGFESAGFVRGINGRGAKDVADLGPVKFESIRGDMYAECLIDRQEFSQPVSRPVTGADRERLQIHTGNGTTVTLTPRSHTTIPNFEPLARDLDRHIELRYHCQGLPHIPVLFREMRDRGVGREQELVGFQPEGSLILERQLDLPEFARYGRDARLKLFRSPSPLASVGTRGGMARLWRSEAGIIVGDGRTAYDITFFHARGAEDQAAQLVFGELFLPQLSALLREFEEIEASREADPGVPGVPLNPSQVTDPDRLGLNREHPFVQAVEAKVRPLIEQTLASLQQSLTPSAEERVSRELREALDRLGEELAERLEATETGPTDGPEMPWGLTMIPGGVRVELGKSKRIGVYYRGDVDGSPDELLCDASASSDAIHLTTTSFVLERVEERPGLFRGSVEVTGRRIVDLVVVRVSLGDKTATAKVSVREPIVGPVVLDKDLQFSQRRYSSVPGRRKRVEVFADPSLAERDVIVRAAGGTVALSHETVRLEFEARRGIAVAVLFAESAETARDTLEVQCGELTDQSDVQFKELGARPKIEFKFEEVDSYGPGRRFKWDQQVRNLVRIAAKHATLARVLGPPAEGWPGQHEPQTRAILAEMICEAFVDRRMQAELPSLSTGPENSVDPVDYENQRYTYFEECFLLCHEALTPAYRPERSSAR